MLGKKLKYLLEMYDITLTRIAKEKGTSVQSISNKFRNNRFFASDLIEYAELTDTELAFIDKKTGKQIISFDTSDIENKPSED